MSNTFNLTIKTPVAEAVHEEVKELHLDTEQGRIAILPGHASLTGSVVFSKILVRSHDTEKEFFIQDGIIYTEVGSNTVELLCMSYEEVHEVTESSVDEYINMIKVKLERHEDLNDYQISTLHGEKVALEKKKELLIKSGK
jgi:F0F1-type ATP synthase epsilon subunit